MRRKIRLRSWNSRKRFKRQKRRQKRRSMHFGTSRLFFRTFEAAPLKTNRRTVVPIVFRKLTIPGTRMRRAIRPLSVTSTRRSGWQRPSHCIFLHKQTRFFIVRLPRNAYGERTRFYAKRPVFLQKRRFFLSQPSLASQKIEDTGRKNVHLGARARQGFAFGLK